MRLYGLWIVLILSAIGVVLGALASVALPLGFGISFFWVAIVIVINGGIWFGAWGVIAAIIFPMIATTLAHVAFVNVLAYVPADMLQALIPAWAFRHFKLDFGIEGRKGLINYAIWGAIIPSITGAIMGVGSLVILKNESPSQFFPLAVQWFAANLVVLFLLGVPVQRELTPLLRNLGVLVSGWWAIDKPSTGNEPMRMRDLPIQLKVMMAMCAAGVGPLMILSLLELILHGQQDTLTPLFLTISLVLMVIAVGFLSRETVRPLHQLESQVKKLVLNREGKLEIDRADEVGQLANAFSDLLVERQQADEKIHSLAFYDQITGLPNRLLLKDRLRQAMVMSVRSGNYGGLLLINLDHFKVLNETIGIDHGDKLLQLVADALKVSVRIEDTVARTGGDEFSVLLTNLGAGKEDGAVKARILADKIRHRLQTSYSFGETTYHSSASLGLSLFQGQQTSAEDIQRQCDLAMRRSKSEGRNTISFFDPAMEDAVIGKAALEQDLREAIQECQFTLYYQPQIVGGSSVTGVEALIRWNHPKRGQVSPVEFIQFAEDTGLILPIGDWVLNTACMQLAAWANRPHMAQMTIAVNVSPKQFRQANFVEKVAATLEHTGANPRFLKIELTESLLVEDVENTIAQMFLLKAKGVGFSLDDFGTGYSSLAYLKRMPIDQLKIDKSFVGDVLTNTNDATIAKAVIALAKSLGMSVIAEGVETLEQRDFLAESGCHVYQGYLYSRPVPLHELELFLQKLN